MIKGLATTVAPLLLLTTLSDAFAVPAPSGQEGLLLKIKFHVPARDEENALQSVDAYTRSFPFSAVLPVQPLTHIPEVDEDGNPSVRVSFLRKKTDLKSGVDGGVLFRSKVVDEYDGDNVDEYEMPGGSKKPQTSSRTIQLCAHRITEGQTVAKIFSEKQIVKAFVNGIDEPKGNQLLESNGIVVKSLFHLWLLK